MRVALTQGMVHLGEAVDCMQQEWSRILEAWGHLPFPVPGALRRPERLLAAIGADVLIVTGGPLEMTSSGRIGELPEQEATERRLIAWCASCAVPVIGISRGMEVLLSTHGGQMHDIAGHLSSRHLVSVRETPFTGSSGLQEVNSFHRHAVESTQVPDPLVPFAWDADGNVEAFHWTTRGGRLRELGLMWHPEIDGVADWGSLSLNSVLRYIEAHSNAKSSSAR